MVFEPIIIKRGRPKHSREGRKGTKKNTTKGKAKQPNFIEEVESVFPKKQNMNLDAKRKYHRGPYKQNSTTSGNDSMSNCSGRGRYKRGPYKTSMKSNLDYRKPYESKKNQTNKSNSTEESSISSRIERREDSAKEETIRGPKRAPHTRKAMRRDYPEISNIHELEPGQDATNTVEEICYTCGFPFDRFTLIEDERVVYCDVCNECEVHQSCLRNCRICDNRNTFCSVRQINNLNNLIKSFFPSPSLGTKCCASNYMQYLFNLFVCVVQLFKFLTVC